MRLRGSPATKAPPRRTRHCASPRGLFAAKPLPEVPPLPPSDWTQPRRAVPSPLIGAVGSKVRPYWLSPQHGRRWGGSKASVLNACGGYFRHETPVYQVRGAFLQFLSRAVPAAFLPLPSLSPGPTSGPRRASPLHPRSPQLRPPRRSPGRPARGCGHVASWRGSGRRRSRASSGRSSRSRPGTREAGRSGGAPPGDPRGWCKLWRSVLGAKSRAHAPTEGWAGRGAAGGPIRMCGRGCSGQDFLRRPVHLFTIHSLTLPLPWGKCPHTPSCGGGGGRRRKDKSTCQVL